MAVNVNYKLFNPINNEVSLEVSIPVLLNLPLKPKPEIPIEQPKTENTTHNNLRGAQGIQGATGIQGPVGLMGIQGHRGPQGPAGKEKVIVFEKLPIESLVNNPVEGCVIGYINGEYQWVPISSMQS